MDQTSLLEPFHNLLAYGGIIIPLATAVPPLLVHFRRTDTSRSLALLFWAPAPLLLVAIAVESLCLYGYGALPPPLVIFVVVTCGVLIAAYVMLGGTLPSILDAAIAGEESRRLAQLTKLQVLTPPTLLKVESEPTQRSEAADPPR